MATSSSRGGTGTDTGAPLQERPMPGQHVRRAAGLQAAHRLRVVPAPGRGQHRHLHRRQPALRRKAGAVAEPHGKARAHQPRFRRLHGCGAAARAGGRRAAMPPAGARGRGGVLCRYELGQALRRLRPEHVRPGRPVHRRGRPLAPRPAPQHPGRRPGFRDARRPGCQPRVVPAGAVEVVGRHVLHGGHVLVRAVAGCTLGALPLQGARERK
mmetsp:Transcript_63011/g.177729  ORF Transcript_63011/g.177729 Transcript_63011/m.177729 type:complete len:212 (+) Transcript_63011:105-740(+)